MNGIFKEHSLKELLNINKNKLGFTRVVTLDQYEIPVSNRSPYMKYQDLQIVKY